MVDELSETREEGMNRQLVRTAYHEAGHAAMARFLGRSDARRALAR
jgi:hypothetical protein